MPADDWRHLPPKAASADATVQDWRRGRGRSVASPERALRWKVGLGWATLLFLCGGFLWLSTWVRPPRPGQLVLLGAGYQTNLLLPPNVAGLNALRNLAAWSEKSAPLLRAGPEG